MTETKLMYERVAKLLDDVKAKKAEITALEKKLADAYAEDGDAVVVMKDLQLSRADLGAMLGALKELEQKAFDTQLREHTEMSKAVEEEARAKFTSTMEDIASSLRAVKKPLGKALKDRTITKKTMAQMLDAVADTIWAAMLAEFNESYKETVPCYPSKPVPRDDQGDPLDAFKVLAQYDGGKLR
jgi:hypothetical protein